MSKQLDAMSLFAQIEEPRLRQVTSFNQNAVTDRVADTYWNKCLNIIKDNVSGSVFSTWFEPIKALSYHNELLTVKVPSQFFCEWIEGHYYSLLQKTIFEVLGEGAKVKYHIDVAKDVPVSDSITLPAFKYPPSNLQINSAFAPAVSSQAAEPMCTNLNARYTFENLVVGESNQLAISAANAVANNPGGTRFNPLFIYGNAGLGKTHISEAIGNHIAQKNKRLKVRYITTDEFTIEFVNAIHNNKINDFKSLYRSVDVLIIDDIQFLTSKEKTQDNFFHIFNALHQLGKQIVLTSDKPPKDLKDIDERLISRFQWGLTVDVQQPDLEMRIALLNKKAEDEGIDLPYEVSEFIARHVTSNIRELEGTLITMLAKHTFDRKEINLSLAKEIVEGIAIIEDRPLTIDIIKEKVAKFYNISVEIMESKTRKHEIALARQMSMFLAKQMTELSLKGIGSHFGGRDHSTVMHSCQTIENYLVIDKTVKNAYEMIKKQLETR